MFRNIATYKVGDCIKIVSIHVKEQAVTPPPPFNPASFVKMLEKTGIGRPSTYSSIIEKIQDKNYVTLGTNPKLDVSLNEWILHENKTVKKGTYTQKIGGQSKIFLVTDLGQRACDFMDTSPIEPIVHHEFTSKLEDKLDCVAQGKIYWKDLVVDFYNELKAKLDYNLFQNCHLLIKERKIGSFNYMRQMTQS